MAMKEIKCKNSVEYYNHYDDEKCYYIVMEKCDEDLNDFLKRNKHGLSESMIKDILLQLNEAFKMMYKYNIIHRDLKPENILINKNPFVVKLADFGLSRAFKNTNFSTRSGTPLYAAPEQLFTKKYNPTKCDLWSIGVIIYKLRFYDENEEIPVGAFYAGNIPEEFDNKLLDDLVRKLIVYDENKRIGWNEYFNHPFF